MSPRPTEPPEPLGDAPRPSRARRERTLDDDIGARVQAGRAAFAAIRTLRVIRGYFVAYAILLGLALWVLWAADASPVALSVTLVLAAVATAGALLVVQQPLVWTIVNAALATPLTAFAVYSAFVGGGSLSGMLIAFTGLAFWAAVPVARRLQQLMRDHPDLWAFRRTQGGDVGKHAAKWRAEAQRARRRVLLGLGVTILAIVGLGWWVSQRKPAGPAELPPPTQPFETAESAWRSAWNRSSVVEVKAFLAASEKAQHEPFFDQQRKKRKWERLPTLAAPTVSDHGTHRRSAEYALDDRGIPLKVYWEWEPERWVVVNWSFPNR